MSNHPLALPDPPAIDEAALLETDDRWLAVQRILVSSGFQRAGQLRKILVYITTSLILTPEKSVREYEIACDVLGRRSDFDPLEDNIVRAQMSHLRRKLETYYREEGRSDPLRLSIPKGSYLPHFAEVRHPPASDAAGSPGFAEAAQLSQRNAGATASTGPYRRLLVFFSVACVALLATTAVLVRKLAAASAPKASAPAAGNAFVQFLSHLSGPVKIVLPDTSLVAIQEKFDAPSPCRSMPVPTTCNRTSTASTTPSFVSAENDQKHAQHQVR